MVEINLAKVEPNTLYIVTAKGAKQSEIYELNEMLDNSEAVPASTEFIIVPSKIESIKSSHSIPELGHKKILGVHRDDETGFYHMLIEGDIDNIHMIVDIKEMK